MRTQPAAIKDRLAELAHEHRVPGASLAIWSGSELVEDACGVANVATGVEVSEDTLFQIGSITKLYTATLVMQLVEQGLIELDSPVCRYLPGIRFADEHATQSVTVAHLLAHTSGLEGDHVVDGDRGADALERYVSTCGDLGSLTQPGERFSYCNAGYVILGRLVAVLREQAWDDALREQLLAPLGAKTTLTLPDEVILHSAAVGHLLDAAAGGEARRVDRWGIPRSMGPAGIICATAREVIEFARMHLARGSAPTGSHIFSSESAAAMQRSQTSLPRGIEPGLDGWGLGWMIFDWGGERIVGHDGGTFGQFAFLRMAPDRDYAVALLTNCSAGPGLARDLFPELFGQIGISIPGEPQPIDPAEVRLADYVGTYRRLHVEILVEEGDGCLLVSSRASGPLEAFWQPENRMPLRPAGEHTFVAGGQSMPYVFSDFVDGRPTWLYSEYRAHRREP